MGDDPAEGKRVFASPGEETAFWAPIREEYEDGNGTQLEICARFGVTLSELKWRIKRDCWPTRYRSRQVDRPQIIKRLFRVLELQVKSLETEMTEMDRTDRRSGDREVSLLGKLATNLDKLLEFDAKNNKAGTRQRTKHMQDMRNKLVERIEQLKRS